MHGWSHDMYPGELGEDRAPRCCECRTTVMEDEEVVVEGRILCGECAYDVLGPLGLAGVREVWRAREKRALEEIAGVGR